MLNVFLTFHLVLFLEKKTNLKDSTACRNIFELPFDTTIDHLFLKFHQKRLTEQKSDHQKMFSVVSHAY